MPAPQRLLVKTRGCDKCRVVHRAVTHYNSIAPLDKKINVYRMESPAFAKHRPFLKKLTGLSSLPTPFIYFEGNTLMWNRGEPEFIETLAHLKALGGIP